MLGTITAARIFYSSSVYENYRMKLEDIAHTSTKKKC